MSVTAGIISVVAVVATATIGPYDLKTCCNVITIIVHNIVLLL